VEHEIADPVGTGPRSVLITGAEGQLGAALQDYFWDAEALSREGWDVTQPYPLEDRPDLVLHAAAWTKVDDAETDRAAARRVNVEGTKNVAALGAPVVYYSTDYVFDGTKSNPYVESDRPNPLSVYAQTKLEGEGEIERGWIIRSSWLFGWHGHNFLRTMLRLGAENKEVAVVDDQRGSPTFVDHLALATQEVIELPHGLYHVAADGDCTWADFAEEIFFAAGLTCRVRRITTEEYGAPAPRPAYSVLRSEKGAPRLPHWRQGMRDCLMRLGIT
jgi:dTDP-4-dehydrorhamnose reductase